MYNQCQFYYQRKIDNRLPSLLAEMSDACVDDLKGKQLLDWSFSLISSSVARLVPLYYVTHTCVRRATIVCTLTQHNT
jgi:hypothetical protein